MNILILTMLLGCSSVSMARSFSHYLSKTVVIQKEFTDPEQEHIEKAKRYDEWKKKKENYNCSLAYRGTPVKILKEEKINRVQVEIKAGTCKGYTGFVDGRNIEVR